MGWLDGIFLKYRTAQDTGVDVPQRSKTNYVGLTVTDDAANDATIVTGGTGGVNVKDEGTPIAGNPHTTFNFVGAGVAATNVGGVATITVGGSSAPTQTTLLNNNTQGNGAFPNTVSSNFKNVAFTAGAGPILFVVSGTGGRGDGTGPLDLEFLIDGSTVKRSTNYAPSVGFHVSFRPLYWTATLSPGAHTVGVNITTANWGGGQCFSDNNDFASIEMFQY